MSVGDRQGLLKNLAETVSDAAVFLAGADESLFDGHQTARQVLSHLVFWHREYVAIVQALATGRRPNLKGGTFAELNEAATCEFEHRTMEEMAKDLLKFHENLAQRLSDFRNWDATFLVKQGGRRKDVAGRVAGIEAHIRNHVKRLRRAQRLGPTWIRAYYTE